MKVFKYNKTIFYGFDQMLKKILSLYNFNDFND